MKKETLEKGMGLLVNTFPNRDFNFDILWELLKDIPDQNFLIAVKDLCSTTAEIYPGTNIVALVREIALSGVYLLSGEAWESVLKQIRKVGYMGTPIFKNAVTGKAVNAIGWEALCSSENISIERAHFLKIYESYLRREKENNIKLPEVKSLIEKTTKQLSNGKQRLPI